MPRLNGTGPNGEGPRTGRVMGRCNSDNKGLSKEQILQKDAAVSPKKGLGFMRGLRLCRRKGFRSGVNGQ